jgi:hypothetical protein
MTPSRLTNVEAMIFLMGVSPLGDPRYQGRISA